MLNKYFKNPTTCTLDNYGDSNANAASSSIENVSFAGLHTWKPSFPLFVYCSEMTSSFKKKESLNADSILRVFKHLSRQT